MLQRYSVRLRIYSRFMKYLSPHWRLRASSLFPSGDVGRRQQIVSIFFLLPLTDELVLGRPPPGAGPRQSRVHAQARPRRRLATRRNRASSEARGVAEQGLAAAAPAPKLGLAEGLRRRWWLAAVEARGALPTAVLVPTLEPARPPLAPRHGASCRLLAGGGGRSAGGGGEGLRALRQSAQQASAS